MSKSEPGCQFLCRYSAVNLPSNDSSQKLTWPNHRAFETAGCKAIAELEPVGYQPVDSKVSRKWPHHVVKTLADQDYVLAFRYQSGQHLD